jgi:hypothetical protein
MTFAQNEAATPSAISSTRHPASAPFEEPL